MGVDAVSYEELQRLYHRGGASRATLLSLVRKINAGALHPAAAALLGANLLSPLGEPDGGTRPIGVGSALRRLAGR